MRNFFISLMIVLSGCSTLKITPIQKLMFYNCHYYEDEDGFCCEYKVPKKDWAIFNCETGRELNEGR